MASPFPASLWRCLSKAASPSSTALPEKVLGPQASNASELRVFGCTNPPRSALSPPCTAYAISDLIPEDLVVPRCGMSDAFANHRKPRTSWRSRKEADAAPRGTSFFAGPGKDGDHENQWAEAVRHQARIIRGRQSMRNAWPWQVRNHRYEADFDLALGGDIMINRRMQSVHVLM